MDDFDQCIPITLDFEGGNDDNPHDPGGRTSRGITQREWNAYTRTHPQFAGVSDVWKAPQAAIIDVYRTNYWNPVSGPQWPKGPDLCVFDAGVNSGPGKSLVWARAALGQRAGTFVFLAAMAGALKDKVTFVKTYQAKRLSFLEALRTWKYFGRGWRSRVAGIESIATKWALAEAGHPAELVKEKLQQTAATARDRSNAAAGTAAAAPAAPVVHSSYAPHDVWVNYAVDVALVVGAIFLVIWLVHVYMNHNARAQAFLEEARK